MPAYDGDLFQPPAPVASVTLRSSETGEVVHGVPMLLDTGADVTLIPQSAIDALRILTTESTNYEVMGFDGTIRRTAHP